MSGRAGLRKNRTFETWCKYEDIAMHFNDLLIQLRTRSLAGIGAVAALIGIFADNLNDDPYVNWVIASSIFAALAVVWVAIFFLDVFYYNRLLRGSVAAILEIEAHSKFPAPNTKLQLSTKIVQEFDRPIPHNTNFGVIAFYVLVFFLIFAALVLSVVEAYDSRAIPQISLSHPAPSAPRPPPPY